MARVRSRPTSRTPAATVGVVLHTRGRDRRTDPAADDRGAVDVLAVEIAGEDHAVVARNGRPGSARDGREPNSRSAKLSSVRPSAARAHLHRQARAGRDAGRRVGRPGCFTPTTPVPRRRPRTATPDHLAASTGRRAPRSAPCAAVGRRSGAGRGPRGRLSHGHDRGTGPATMASSIQATRCPAELAAPSGSRRNDDWRWVTSCAGELHRVSTTNTRSTVRLGPSSTSRRR